MARTDRLKEAANAMLAALRDYIAQLETEEAAEGSVPASAVNMPPETRAQRPEEMRRQAEGSKPAEEKK